MLVKQAIILQAYKKQSKMFSEDLGRSEMKFEERIHIKHFFLVFKFNF